MSDAMTDDEMNRAIIRRVTSLPAGHPARHSAATALGVIPRKPSEDAGEPYEPLFGNETLIAFSQIATGLAVSEIARQKAHTAPDSPVQREVEVSGGEWPQTNGDGAWCETFGHSFIPWSYHYSAGVCLEWKICRRCRHVPDAGKMLFEASRLSRNEDQ